MAKAVWHYTDRKTGKRTEVWLDDEQQAVDLICVREFQALEGAVFGPDKVDPNRDPRTAQILEWGAQLPPLKAQHWREELERIGAKVAAAPRAEKAKATTGQLNTTK